jgi:hypothetical protein
MPATNWTADEHFFVEGLSNEEIAQVTGRTYEAVARKRRRMAQEGKVSGDPAAAVSLEKAKLQERYLKGADRQRIEEQAKLEILTEAISSAVRAIPLRSIEPQVPGTYAYDEEEVVLLLGDLQVGEVVDFTATGGLGFYNREVFDTRADTLRQKVVRIVRGHQSYQPIRVLNVFGLGDFVEGMTIYPGQLSHLDLDLIDQLFVGSYKLAEIIVGWLGVFEHINLFGVLGNHGRIGRKGELPTTANMDYLFLKHLELLLKEYIDAGRITCEFPKTFFQVIERQNHRFMLVHGDDIKGWMSLPWYGAQRAVQRWQELLQERFDYFIFGHHHTTAQWESNHKEVIANGSFVGTNEYSAKTMNVGGRPSQIMFGLHPHTGRTLTYRLFLDDGEPERRATVHRGQSPM